MKKNKTILILIFSIIVTIFIIGILVFFLKIIKNKNQHISVVLTTLEEKMKEKENAQIFTEKITEIKLLQDSIDSYFLDTDKVDIFVDYLEEIGLKLGSQVSVKSIEIISKTENIVSVELSISGTFQKVMTTINYVENIPYQVNITKIYLNKDVNPITQENIENTKQDKIIKTPIWQADVSFNIISKS